MSRPRKHVHGLRPRQAVAPRGEALHVPGEGGGVAGDVGQRGTAGVGDGLQQRGVGPLAGRVEYGGVKALAHPEQAGNLCGGVAAEEPRLCFEAVALGVALRVGDGGGNDLDAGDPAGMPRRAEGDRARAAIGVQHVHVAAGADAGGFQRGGVQPLRLVRVDLEEGLGRDREVQAHQRVRQRFLAEQAGAAPVQRVGGAAVQLT